MSLLHSFTRYTVCFSLLLVISCTAFGQPTTSQINQDIQGLRGTLISLVKKNLNDISLQAQDSIQNHLIESKKIIQRLLEAHGYFRADIQSKITKTPKVYYFHHTVSQGEQLLIKKLFIQLVGEGKSSKALQKTLNALRLREGEAMTTENYQEIKQTLYKALISEGYLDATWKTHTVSIDLKQYIATVTLVLETGTRYTVGPIQFSHNTYPLKPEFFKRYLTIHEGDTYRPGKILQSQIHLQNSGYLQKALIETSSNPESSVIPITVSLTPASKYYLLFGAGFSTDIGLRLKTEGLARQLNHWGHQISCIGQISNKQIYGSGLYAIPGSSSAAQHHHIQMEYNGYYKKADIEVSLSSIMNSVAIHRKIENDTTVFSYLFTDYYAKWKLTPFFSFHHARFKPTNVEKRESYYGWIPGILVSKTKMKWFKDTHHYDLHLQAQWAHFASTPFFKFECEGTYAKCLADWLPSSYLILRGRYGSLLTPSLDDIPHHLRFHAGGYRYPRGHKEYRLSAHTLGGGLEIRKQLAGLLYLNPFFEINYDTDYKMPTVKGSTGVSFCLWYLPIGHIEIGGVMRINPDISQSRYGILAKISTDL